MKKRITILIAAVVVIAGAIAIKTYIDYRRAQDEMYRKLEKRNREKRKFGRDMKKARSKMKRAENKLKRLQKRLEAGKKKAEKIQLQTRKLEFRNEQTRRDIRELKVANELGVKDYEKTYDTENGFKGFKSFENPRRIRSISERIKELNKSYEVNLEVRNDKIYGIGFAEEKIEIEKKQIIKMLEANLKQELENKEVALKILNTAKKIEQMEKTIKQYEEWEKLPDEEWDKIADKIKLLPDDDGKDDDEKDDEKDE